MMQSFFGASSTGTRALRRARVNLSRLLTQWAVSRLIPRTSPLGSLSFRKVAWLLLFGLCPISFGQQPSISAVANAELPNAPGVQEAASSPNSPTLPQQATASISGIVRDINGSTIPGAKVTLVGHDGTKERVVLANDRGEFSFADLTPGTFQVTIASAGLETFVSPEIVLGAGEEHALTQIALPIATTNTEVGVTATPDEVAVAQVKAEEKQRILGIVPNFYSSYIWNAAPLRPKLKYELAFRSIFDPVTFLGSAGTAGVEQAQNTFPGYGSGPGAYGKRFGATYADTVTSRLLGSAVLPSLFHQDPRYFYRGTGTIPSRALYALERTFIARGDNGHSQFNYSHILGNFATAGISTIYHAPGDRSASLTIRNGFIITAGNAAVNLLREFVLHEVTSKIPDQPQAKP